MSRSLCAAGARAFLASTVADNTEIAPGIHEVSSDWPGPSPSPGQFFMLRPARSEHFLGRPISVAGFLRDGESGTGRLSFLIARRGLGSAELCGLRKGEGLLLQGPLGSSWPLPHPGDRLPVLVAGGIGMAPLAFLASCLEPGSYDFLAGFRDAPYGLAGLAPRRLFTRSESGTGATRGRVLDGFDPEPGSIVYGCGPEPMLAALLRASEERGLESWLSLERRMACGAGACLGCVVRTRSGMKRCCEEGPVFPGKELDFDDL